MRKFYIETKEGLRYDLQNKNKCFFNNPSGLGFAKTNTYVDIGDYFAIDNSKYSQKMITGELIFINDYYKNYNEFIKFIKSSSDYKLVYNYDDTDYYIDIDIISVEKSDTKKKKYLNCNIIMASKSLWYKATQKIISITEKEGNSSNWDVEFDFSFYDNLFDNITINNQGQIETPFEIEIEGAITNPKLEVYQNNEKINELNIYISTENINDKILYGNKDNNLYIYKEVNGIKTNAMSSLLLENNNWFKLPIGTSIIKISSEIGTITSVKVTYYEEYEAV